MNISRYDVVAKEPLQKVVENVGYPSPCFPLGLVTLN